MNKIKISRPIIVEGKYDKIKLTSILDANIITTDGFGVFNSAEKVALIRALAAPSGVIVLTDSDGAGKVIRTKISSILPQNAVTHLYIPQIFGKEKRKSVPSKEGTLGVEGIDADILRKIFEPLEDDRPQRRLGGVSKQDFYADGLSGGENSAEKRDALALQFCLPRGMSANALLAAINIISDEDGYKSAVKKLFS